MNVTLKRIKNDKQWINWYLDGEKKVPYSAKTGKIVGTTQEYKDYWLTYEEANNEAIANKYGVGLVLPKGLCGIDIDGKDINDPFVIEIIKLMDSYTEISPSGKGIHILCLVDINQLPTTINEKGELKLSDKYYMKNPKNKIECYPAGLTNRYLTFTGNVMNDRDILERTEKLTMFLDKYMIRDNTSSKVEQSQNINNQSMDTMNEEEIIEILAKKSEKFNKLYYAGDIEDYNNDDSSADLALCGIIAEYTKNPEQIDRIFRQSKLYREKWEREDYKDRTIKKAIGNRISHNEQTNNPIPKRGEATEYGEELIRIMNLRCYNGKIYAYKNGVYYVPNEKEFGSVILHSIDKKANKTLRNNAIDFAENWIYTENTTEINDNYINFKNGLYDLVNDRFIEHTPEIFTINQLAVNYNPNISMNENVEKYLEKVNAFDPARKLALLQIIGYCMTSKVDLQKSFIFYGKTASNGKSTLAKIIMNLLGRENICSVSLQVFAQRFGTNEIDQKLLNIVSELPVTSVKDVGVFKAAVTGDFISADVKCQNRIQIQPYAKHIFTSNTLPQIQNERTNGFYRRLNILNFTAQFSVAEQEDFKIDPLLEQDALDYLANISLKAYIELMNSKDKSFANENESSEILKMYKTDNDTVYCFLNDESNKYLLRGDIHKPEVWERYKMFCKDNLVQPLTKTVFYSELLSNYNFAKKTRDGLEYLYLKKE